MCVCHSTHNCALVWTWFACWFVSLVSAVALDRLHYGQQTVDRSGCRKNSANDGIKWVQSVITFCFSFLLLYFVSRSFALYSDHHASAYFILPIHSHTDAYSTPTLNICIQFCVFIKPCTHITPHRRSYTHRLHHLFDFRCVRVCSVVHAFHSYVLGIGFDSGLHSMTKSSWCICIVNLWLSFLFTKK